jgi:hypothetical protein
MQEASDNQFNQGAIMQCTVTYAIGLHSYLMYHEVPLSPHSFIYYTFIKSMQGLTNLVDTEFVIR